MPSSTGSELPSGLQAEVDRLSVKCVGCLLSERQAIWDRGLVALGKQVGAGFKSDAMEDALQDAGFRLGMFNFNAQSARFYGAQLG